MVLSAVIPMLIIWISTVFDDQRLGGPLQDALGMAFLLTLTLKGYTIYHVVFVFATTAYNVYKTRSVTIPARHRLPKSATDNQRLHYKFHQAVDCLAFFGSLGRILYALASYLFGF
jgi:hypothetical protein